MSNTRSRKRPRLESNWIVFTPDHSTMLSVDGGFLQAFEVLMDHWYVHYYKPYMEHEIQYAERCTEERGVAGVYRNLLQTVLHDTIDTWTAKRQNVKYHNSTHNTWHRMFSFVAHDRAQLEVDGAPHPIRKEAYTPLSEHKDSVRCSCYSIFQARSVSIVNLPQTNDGNRHYTTPYRITMMRALRLKKQKPVPEIPLPNELLAKIQQDAIAADTKTGIALNAVLQQEGIIDKHACCGCGVIDTRVFHARRYRARLRTGGEWLCRSCLFVYYVGTAGADNCSDICEVCGKTGSCTRGGGFYKSETKHFTNTVKFRLCKGCGARHETNLQGAEPPLKKQKVQGRPGLIDSDMEDFLDYEEVFEEDDLDFLHTSEEEDDSDVDDDDLYLILP